MTPTTSELLVGNFMTFAEPPPPESAGDFMAGRIGVTAMISLLAAQEAESGAQVRVAENRAVRALLARAAPQWDARLGGRLSVLATTADEDFTLSALDRANADLRTALIALQEAVEDEDSPAGRALEGDLIRLLKLLADGRALHLPPLPARG